MPTTFSFVLVTWLILGFVLHWANARTPWSYLGNVTYDTNELMEYCSTLEDLYLGIRQDLRLWNTTGITEASLQQSTKSFTTAGHQKGMTLAFYNGVAYVIHKPTLGGLGHHLNILFTYMLVMLDLQRQFGLLIPDVEFVIASSDRPLALIADYKQVIPPVMRFCSSDQHADIKIPIFHFYTKKYTNSLLSHVPGVNRDWPWDQKVPKVFGRFSKYHRHIHPEATDTLREGADGENICVLESPKTLSCTVRQHFMDWAEKYPDTMDIKSGPRVSLLKHAQYKYLVHVDGQALSSRMEQLMPLNSLIIKEESGYKTFYYHLLKPYVNYVPFWKKRPEEILDVLKWAQQNDEPARNISQASQELAVKYLNKKARACYWQKLFVEYAKLMSYQPRREGKMYAVTVEEYLQTVAMTFEKGKQIHRIEP